MNSRSGLEPTPARERRSVRERGRQGGGLVPPPEPPRFVFVGGTGRSGTHVVAKLINRNSAYKKVPNEARFHSDPGGFPDLLSGKTSLEEFVRELRGPWWKGWERFRRTHRGLHRYVPEERFEAAIASFEAAFERDPEAACRELYIDLLWPLAAEEGAAGLVEQSCDTVAAAPTLLRLFPEARFIHAVRDGRDAAASRVNQARWLAAPRTMKQGLRWWERRLRRIDEGLKAIPYDRFIVVNLDELSEFRRRRIYRRLRRFLALENEPPMRRFWRNRITPELAKRGRWRDSAGGRRQGRIEREYAATLDRLERDEIHCAPVLRRNFNRRHRDAVESEAGQVDSAEAGAESPVGAAEETVSSEGGPTSASEGADEPTR